MKFGSIILAAGFSHRMGNDKAQLNFRDKKTFLDQLIEQYTVAGVKSIQIITQSKSITRQHNIDITINKHPDRGRSYSIHIGLQKMKDFDFVFIQNIDNPFTTKKLIESMLNKAENNKALVPFVKGKKGHPILLSSKIIHSILYQDEASFDFKNTISQFEIELLPWEQANILANINIPAEYQFWFHRP